MVKTCSKCKVKKPVSEFNKDKKTKDGLSYECKSCEREYRQANKERMKEYKKEYYQANKKNIKESVKEYRQANKEYYNEYYKEYNKERRKTDPLFKMCGNLRSRTLQAFKNKGYSKNTKTQEMLGVDWDVAKQHIERQFKKGMNWNNQGEWHIDHIIPLASANTLERLEELSHYTNLQPMWAIDNLIKNDKIIGQQTLLRI